MKKIIFLLVLFMSYIQTQAQDYAKNHVIIALDARSDMNVNPSNWMYNTKTIEDNISSILSKNGIENGIVSTMTYSMESHENDLSKYTHKISVAEPFSLDNIKSFWKKLSQTREDGSRFSLLSIAKPYCLKAVKAESNDNTAKLAYRTFLILITDLRYNGNDDFHDELRHKPGMNQALLNEILGEVKIVQQNYFYDFISQVQLNRGYMMLFECIPQQKYFALESITEYPHNIVASRTKDGYTLSFEFKSYDNPNYELLKSEVSIGNEVVSVEGYGKVEFLIPSDTWNGTDTIHANIKSWVRLLDGIYNRTILSPDGAELQGRDGLNKFIVVEPEPKAKLLWILPFPDFLFNISFWTSDQTIAAGVWSVLIILALIVLIIYLIGKTMKYDPKKVGPSKYNV